ncbi:MAG: tetratricopeptide repeat protein [Cyanobacteria bacterium SZAS-4]|nr:tetratricopeptide repeat protein [Cyanobacteria bacterium SZAS-4]
MTGNFANQFKKDEDVELVSEQAASNAESVDSNVGEETSAPENGETLDAKDVDANDVGAKDVDGPPDANEVSDGSTPWKKRKANKSYRKRFWTIALVTVLIICGTLNSAVQAIGPALVLSHVGLAIGNRWLILKAYEIGYQNSPYSVSNLVTWANERAAYNKLDAIELYNDCLKLDPKYPYTYLNRGATYYYLKEYEKAMADYDKAIELNPRYALALDNRASLWVDSGELEAALKDETRAIAARADYHTYYFNRARIYRRLKRYDEALKDFTRAQELGENYQRVQHEIEATRELQQ